MAGNSFRNDNVLSFRYEMIPSPFDMMDVPHFERIDDLSFGKEIQIHYRVIGVTELTLRNDDTQINYRVLFG